MVGGFLGLVAGIRSFFFLKNCLPNLSAIISSDEDDRYLWKTGTSSPKDTFSTSETWKTLHPQGSSVFWCDQVWFTGRIPKHAFITWITARDRLVTRDRMLSWGISVPSAFILWNAGDETRQHLFFDCSFSSAVWSFFCIRFHLSPPTPFEDILWWLKDPTRH